MGKDVKIISMLPEGAFGASSSDSLLDSFLRVFAETKKDEGEWAEKYGTHYESEKVIMRPFCWCSSDECPYCGFYGKVEPDVETIEKYGIEEDGDGFITAPNFWYKPLDFKVWWYKYIGRSIHTNKELSDKDFYKMVDDLIGIIK